MEAVPRERTADSALQLSQMVLGPAASQLKARRLLIVSDGGLQYIPFAALPMPLSESSAPLVTNYEIVNLPSSSTLGLKREEPEPKLAPHPLAIFADPVFSAEDERVIAVASQPADASPDFDQLALRRAARELDVGGWQRLLGTRREAAAIAALVGMSETMQALDFDANLPHATSPQLSQYRVIHFATHGLLNTKSPELSGLVLSLVNKQGKSENGFLRLREIFNLDLAGAELVVLSACQTGLGKAIRGEGLVGLTRGFMYAGAPRVVVSLWQVDDAATAEMMARFYRLLLQENLPAAQALRAAQLEMLEQTQWRSPYYWAAFTFQGEWR